MCGRYNLRATPAELQQFFDLFREPAEVSRPRYNIAPTQTVAAIRATDEGRDLVWMRWGLVPFWVKDLKSGPPLINAKGETVAEKPSFRTSFQRRRCLIPATGFYEWKRTGPKTKQPMHIERADHGLFAMAGLWERWDKGDQPLESCTIITTTANSQLAGVHDRMPVILQPDDYDLWLGEVESDPAALQELLQPYPDDDLQLVPVSTAVNNVRNESEECVQECEV